MKKSNYFKTYEYLINLADGIEFEKGEDEAALEKDPFQTDEQYHRDKIITELLSHYAENYYTKTIHNHKYKKILFYCMLILLFFLCVAIASALILSVIFKFNNIALIIGSLVSLIGLPIGLLKIITDCLFSKDEETHIANIVKATQQNDLENKKTNILAFKENVNNYTTKQ